MTQISKAELSEYNFLVAVDTSGSMGGAGRWESAKNIALAVANFAGSVDTDGIDIITFGATVEHFEKSTADKITEIFTNKQPNGSTPLNEALILADSIRKNSSKKAFVVVVTDGAPDDEFSCIKTITDISNNLNDDKDCSFSFIQIGDDSGATKFLNRLDDDLKGAKFDIVDHKTEEQFKTLTFEQFFYAAQND